MAYTSVHLPVGSKVEIETTAGGGTYTDLGVTMNETTLAVTYDQIKVTGSRAEGVLNFFKNMSIEATFSLLQIELSNIHKLMSGSTAYATVAGSLVTGHVQTLVANTWEREKFIPFDQQQGAGTVPASIVVTNPSTLTNDTDYIIVQDASGVWGIIVLDTKGTLTNNLVFTYNYTPSASRTLSMGSPSIDVTARALRVSKELDSGKWWTMVIYAAVNTSGLSFSMPRYDADEPSILEVTMTGQLDTTRSDLDQLFKITDEFGITDI